MQQLLQLAASPFLPHLKMCSRGFAKWVLAEPVGTATTGSTTWDARSATRVHEEWQNVNTGDAVPAGPTSFLAAIVESSQHFVLEVKNGKKKIPRLHFTLAYELREAPEGTRLVTRMRSHINVPGGKMIERLILGPGDGIMLRRQLLTLAARISEHHSPRTH